MVRKKETIQYKQTMKLEYNKAQYSVPLLVGIYGHVIKREMYVPD